MQPISGVLQEYQVLQVLDRFLNHFSDRLLSELWSALVICCPANPFGLRIKSGLFIELN